MTVQQTPANSVTVPVTMVIGPPAVISIAPASIGLTYTLGDPSPITQTIRINSLSTTPQTFTLATNLITGTGWLTATANTSTTPSTITATLNATGLTPGSYLGTISVTPSGSCESAADLSQSLTVAAAPTPVITVVQSACRAGLQRHGRAGRTRHHCRTRRRAECAGIFHPCKQRCPYSTWQHYGHVRRCSGADHLRVVRRYDGSGALLDYPWQPDQYPSV